MIDLASRQTLVLVHERMKEFVQIVEYNDVDENILVLIDLPFHTYMHFRNASNRYFVYSLEQG